MFGDAVAILLYQTLLQTMRSTEVDRATRAFMSIASFVWALLGSFVAGVAVGLVTSYLLKRFHKYIEEPEKGKLNGTEVGIMTIAPIAGYLLAEAINLSGIVTILFSGLVLSQYAAENLHLQTRKVLKMLYQATADLCQNTVFLFLGMSAVQHIFIYSYSLARQNRIDRQVCF